MKSIDSKSKTYFLKKELTKRLEKNPHYSMRSFANLLGINIGSLSGLLNGKRPLTLKTAIALCDRLSMDPSEKDNLLQELFPSKKKQTRIVLRGALPERMEFKEESFRIIAGWQHYAILQIIRTKSYQNTPPENSIKWISSQLKISELETKLAIERLEQLHLIKEKKGIYKRTENKVTTADKNTTSSALKKLQKEIREKAIYSLEHDPIEKRSMTSMTMAIDPKKIKEAKLLIEEFQERLSDFLEEGSKEKVYQLEVSLFPIQSLEEK